MMEKVFNLSEKERISFWQKIGQLPVYGKKDKIYKKIGEQGLKFKILEDRNGILLLKIYNDYGQYSICNFVYDV